MHEIYKAIGRVPRPMRPYSSGESGTGKELVARALTSTAPRRQVLSCHKLRRHPRDVAGKRAFGYEKGAFTAPRTARWAASNRQTGERYFSTK